MQKLFENWRHYLIEQDFVSPKDDRGVLKLAGWAEAARGSLIKTFFYDNRRSLEKKIAKRLSKIKNVKSLPTTNKFINEIVSFLKSTEIKFTMQRNSGLDPDYGGPAYYSSERNEIVVEEVYETWLARDRKTFTRMIFHEFGHAMDRAIPISLRRAMGESIYTDIMRDRVPMSAINFKSFMYFVADLFKETISSEPSVAADLITRGGRAINPFGDTNIDAPEIRTVGTAEETRWASKENWRKLLSITKKNLSPERTEKHKEYVVEFYATLKSIVALLGRDITPLDVTLMCTGDWTYLAERIADGEFDDVAWIKSIKKFKRYHGQSLADIYSVYMTGPDEMDTDDFSQRVKDKKRLSHIDKRLEYTINLLMSSETSRMIDCSVGSKKIAQVLNELI